MYLVIFQAWFGKREKQTSFFKMEKTLELCIFIRNTTFPTNRISHS